MKLSLLLALCGAALSAQQLDLSSLDGLAAKAKESSIVDLDEAKLKMAGGFLSGGSKGEDTAKRIAGKLRRVQVRSFEFASDDAYKLSALDGIRKQLQTPGWSRIVEVKEDNEITEVYMYSSGDSSGLAVLTGEPRELTVVNVVGSPDAISEFSKQRGAGGPSKGGAGRKSGSSSSRQATAESSKSVQKE